MTVKQKTKIYSDIDLRFTANPINGDVAKKYDVNAVKQSLRNLILTQYYERPFQPNLGSPIYKLLFENLDQITGNAIQLQVELLINQYEPRVREHVVEVAPLYDQNAFEVTVNFYVYGIPDLLRVTSILSRSR